VLARFVTEAELAALPLRKAPTVDGPVRVVSVLDFDHSPCGGTHPRTTGAVGMVAIRGWARQKSGMRIEFVCGGRALADQRRMTGLLSELAASLSVAQDQLPAALERLRTAETTARRSLEAARDSLLDLEAQQLIAATATNGPPIVHAAFAGRDVGELRALALRIAAAGGVALLGLRAERPHLVFARAEGLPLDAAALLRSVLPLIGGKGGGQPALAQGSGTNPATLDAALAAAFAAAHASQ
jgi:alanyl-tRNA synthetase